MRRAAKDIGQEKEQQVARRMGITQHCLQAGALCPPVALHEFVKRDQLQRRQTHAQRNHQKQPQAFAAQPAQGQIPRLPPLTRAGPQQAQRGVIASDQQRVDRHFDMACQNAAANCDRADDDPQQRRAAKDPQIALKQDVFDHPQNQRQPDSRRHDHGEDRVGDQKTAELPTDASQRSASPVAPQCAQVASHETAGQPQIQHDKPAISGAQRQQIIDDAQWIQRGMLPGREERGAGEQMRIPQRDFALCHLSADERLPRQVLQHHIRQQMVVRRGGFGDLAVGGIRRILKQILCRQQCAVAQSLLVKQQQRHQQQQTDQGDIGRGAAQRLWHGQLRILCQFIHREARYCATAERFAV